MNGWIIYLPKDKKLLLELGVVLTGEPERVLEEDRHNALQCECTMTTEVFLGLEEYWGQFVWGLT